MTTSKVSVVLQVLVSYNNNQTHTHLILSRPQSKSRNKTILYLCWLERQTIESYAAVLEELEVNGVQRSIDVSKNSEFIEEAKSKSGQEIQSPTETQINE